jgi:hypothetical protein
VHIQKVYKHKIYSGTNVNTMQDKDSTLERVRNYIAGSKDKNIKARGIRRMSPTAVAILDNLHEIDVYFDAKSYRLIMEQIWKDGCGNNHLFPPALKGTGLGVLQGLDRAPQVRSYADALEFAKQHLEPIVKEAHWYKRPLHLK